MQPTNTEVELSYPKIWVWVCKIVSYIFHPLFIPTYIFLFLMWQFPFDFAGITAWQLKLKLFSTFWLTAFFPAFAVFLLWRLKFSESIFLRTQKERIIPYFISMFFYWWMYYLSKNQTNQPAVLSFFYFGIFWCSIIGVIINNFIKISLHTMAIAGAATALLLFGWHYSVNINLHIIASLILCGVVTTARMVAGQHTSLELYSGFGLGVACQIFGYWYCM